MKKITYIYAVLVLFSTYLFSCDMLVMQNIDQYPFFTLPAQIGAFNDPYDFMNEFRAMSNQYSGNRDGYGIIAYLNNTLSVARDNRWYKTGFGNYFDENNPDEPFYEALDFFSTSENTSQVLAHARSATGGEGNHPLLFEANGKTYSFMHNGYIFNNNKREIMEFLGAEWFTEHPSQWSGVFPNLNTFIDSELIFHYFMYYILQSPNDLESALRKAFTNKQVGKSDMEYVLKYNNSEKINFVLSDSENLYIYRSTDISGNSYNLSYQIYPGKFVAAKTGSSLENVLAKNQLLRINSQGDANNLSTAPILKTLFTNIQVTNLDSGTHKLTWRIANNHNITGFKVHRGTSKNFANSFLISQLEVHSSSNFSFQITDEYHSDAIIYYWIETIFSNGSTEITSNIPSISDNTEPEDSVSFNLRSLFPNPFKDKLYMDIEPATEFTLKIFNLKGQLVDTLHFSDTESSPVWDTTSDSLNRLANGVYILQFTHNNKKYVRKVLKLN
ncbi:MAG: T9SS type A sorting domain-containing protein [Candidatus Cloacimonadales bacterium]